MTSPSLSKKQQQQQQKKSLAGKKTPIKGLRNVLSQPYDIFWPIIRNDDNEENVSELKRLLEESMPALKRHSPSIPWSHLRKLKKNERRTAREEARSNDEQNSSKPDADISDSFVAGINGVTRSLEKNEAACVLLEANVEPMLLIKHIVSMAELKNVSVIIVNFLKSVTLETVGFASAAIALKRTVARSDDHHFHKLYKKIVQLAKNFERKKTAKVEYENKLSTPVGKILTISNNKDEKQIKDSFKLSSDVYIYRNSRDDERVFKPESARSETIVEAFDVDFISIGNDSDSAIEEESVKKSKRKTRYVDIREKSGGRKSFETKYDDSNLKFYPSSLDNELNKTATDVLYEKRSTILGVNNKDDSTDSRAEKSLKKAKKNINKDIKYESLKVKRIQGNFKRSKATKIPKRNKN